MQSCKPVRQGGVKNDSCKTPAWLYRALDAEFAFDLDPCPLAARPACDGLTLDWHGRRVFCNPPYSAILPWVQKGLTSAALTVFLLPKRYNSLWSRLLMDARAEIRHYEKIVRFDVLGTRKTSHPFGGTMIAIVRRLDRL